MLLLAVGSIVMARWIEVSWVGRGLRAIRASEPAAECSGVPTLKLKLLACAISVFFGANDKSKTRGKNAAGAAQIELCASSSAKGDQGRAGKKGEAYS